jgi:hypothetical protein
MNLLFKIVKNQKGLTIMEITVVMVSLAIASTAVFKSLDTSNKQKDSTKKAEASVMLGSSLTNSVRNVFLDTIVKTQNGERSTQGICSILKTSNPETNIASMYVELPPYQKGIFDKERWSKYLPDLVLAEDQKACDRLFNGEGYNYCFKVNYDNVKNLGLTSSELKQLSPLIAIQVKTVYTNPVADVPFSVFSPALDTSDANSVADSTAPAAKAANSIGFLAQIAIEFNKSKAKSEQLDAPRSIKSFKDLIWVGEVGQCNYGDKKVLAVASSGFGTYDDSVVYNSGGFVKDSSAGSQKPPITVYPITTQAQRGKLVQNDSLSFLTTDDQSLVFTSCNEVKFTCPQLYADDKREYAMLQMEMKLQYNNSNIISEDNANFMKYSPKLDFVHEATKESIDSETNSYFTKYFVDGPEYKPISLREEKLNPNEIIPPYFYKAINGVVPVQKKLDDVVSFEKQHRLPLQIKDEQLLEIYVSDDANGSNSSNNACRKICSSGNGYNTTPQQRYNAQISYNVHYSNVKDGVSTNFTPLSIPVMCTACNFKSCDRYGLKTFGPMIEMPTEALDSGYPQCVVHESGVVDTFLEAAPMDRDKCVSMRMNSGDNSGFSYRAQDCKATKNVLCYNFGKHFLVSAVSDSQQALTRAPWIEASMHCFETSKEILERSSIESLFVQQGFIADPDNPNATPSAHPNKQISEDFLGLANSSSDLISFNNLARQGSFFAPIGQNQEKAIRKFAEDPNNGNLSALKQSDFWVNLKTDNIGDVYAPAPKIHSQEHSWALEWNGSNRLVPRKVLVNLPAQGDASLLLNQIKYRGVASAAISQPYGDIPLRFICRKLQYPHKVFITESKSASFKDGASLCMKQNGIFLPPTTTAGWQVAYSLIAPPAPNKAYPVEENPERFAAWVATQKDIPKFYEPILVNTNSGVINKDGEFIYKGIRSAKEHLCFDTTKRVFYTQGSQCESYFPGNIKDVMNADNYVVKTSLIATILKSKKKLIVDYKLYKKSLENDKKEENSDSKEETSEDAIPDKKEDSSESKEDNSKDIPDKKDGEQTIGDRDMDPKLIERQRNSSEDKGSIGATLDESTDRPEDYNASNE